MRGLMRTREDAAAGHPHSSPGQHTILLESPSGSLARKVCEATDRLSLCKVWTHWEGSMVQSHKRLPGHMAVAAASHWHTQPGYSPLTALLGYWGLSRNCESLIAHYNTNSTFILGLTGKKRLKQLGHIL